MSLGISKEDIAFLKELQHEMLTQDHVSQAAPRFWVVRGTVKEYGFEVGYADEDGLMIDCETFLDDFEGVYEYLIEHHPKTPYKYDKDSEELSYYNHEEDEWMIFNDMEEIRDFLQEQGDDEATVVGCKSVEKNFENTFFLTNKECKKHIEQNYYHYPADAHSYAMTAWRAPEVEKLWNILDRINWDQVETLVK